MASGHARTHTHAQIYFFFLLFCSALKVTEGFSTNTTNNICQNQNQNPKNNLAIAFIFSSNRCGTGSNKIEQVVGIT